MVLQIKGYDCTAISNKALEYQIRKMAKAGTIADAIGYAWQIDGHLHYTLTFPTGNQTWNYDIATQQWWQSAYCDSNGGINRHRCMAAANLNGTIVGQDWQTGALYAMDPTVYSDTVGTQAYPLTYIRTFPHFASGEINMGVPGLSREIAADGKLYKVNKFELDIQTGSGLLDANGNPAQVTLAVSNDRGNSFTDNPLMALSTLGQYSTYPTWRNQGIGRDMVFEISYTCNGEAALNSAWIDVEVLKQ
jgi:hypothetical protein